MLVAAHLNLPFFVLVMGLRSAGPYNQAGSLDSRTTTHPYVPTINITKESDAGVEGVSSPLKMSTAYVSTPPHAAAAAGAV